MMRVVEPDRRELRLRAFDRVREPRAFLRATGVLAWESELVQSQSSRESLSGPSIYGRSNRIDASWASACSMALESHAPSCAPRSRLAR
jgi:hypothetical protein